MAAIDASTLRAWDTANRKVVSRAGGLPALAPLVYQLPRDNGGLGLESLEDATEVCQVEAYVEALNSESMNGQITRAGRRRFLESIERDCREKGSTHAVIAGILGRRGWDITQSEEERTRLMRVQRKTH